MDKKVMIAFFFLGLLLEISAGGCYPPFCKVVGGTHVILIVKL
jgi:hypothetical protein